MTIEIRLAVEGDIPALRDIYSHHVMHGFGTFDEEPPDLSAFKAKWRGIITLGLPWLVACDGGDVLGYAYASTFRPRSGYRYTIEDSVYVREDMRGRGVGSVLLEPLLRHCEETGARQVVAVIGDSQNLGSIALHSKFGFVRIGAVKSVGFKLGRWVDVVMMQRSLNGGDTSLPPIAGAWSTAS
jgi:phosphinothricin acetyltransferase